MKRSRKFYWCCNMNEWNFIVCQVRQVRIKLRDQSFVIVSGPFLCVFDDKRHVKSLSRLVKLCVTTTSPCFETYQVSIFFLFYTYRCQLSPFPTTVQTMTEQETVQIYEISNFPSGFAHMLLAGTAGNALSHISMKDEPFAFTAACVLFGHGLYGALIKTHTSLKWYSNLQNIREWLRLGVKSFSLPLMNAHFAPLIGADELYICSHLASGFAPLVYGLGRKYAETSLAYRSERVLDIVVLGNACSLGYIGVCQESPIALSLAFWQMFIQYFPAVVEKHIDTEIYDIETLGMTVFSLILVVMFRNSTSLPVHLQTCKHRQNYTQIRLKSCHKIIN